MTYETKDEAMKNVSTNPATAKIQTRMINAMYGAGLKVTEKDMKNIELDVHKDNMKKAMSY